MPALAHIGVGLAAKKAAPKINVWLLILAAETVEIVFMILWAIKVEYPPTDIAPGFSPYSHSIISGVLMSLIFGAVVYLITRKRFNALVLGLLVLSHTVMDVLAGPMLAFYPTDTGKHIFFNDNFSIGLGLYKNPVVANTLEYGITALGVVIYLSTKITRLKKKKH